MKKEHMRKRALLETAGRPVVLSAIALATAEALVKSGVPTYSKLFKGVSPSPTLNTKQKLPNEPISDFNAY